MTTLQVCALSGRSLRNMTATLGPGLHVLLALDPTGVDELIPLLDGSSAPRRGKVLLDGRCPYRTPELRRRIGSLWRNETIPSSLSVADSLRQLELLPEVIGRVRGLLDRFGMSELYLKPPAKLNPEQIRAISVAIALSKPEPQLLLLAEPLAFSGNAVSSVVTDLLLEQASRIPVLVVTSSRQTATTFGGPTAELGGGYWRSVPKVMQPSIYSLRVTGASLRVLAAEIIRRPRVLSLRLTSHTEGHEELWLETNDPKTISVDLVRLSLQLGLRLWTLSTVEGA